jgi:hypothetical protein
MANLHEFIWFLKKKSIVYYFGLFLKDNSIQQKSEGLKNTVSVSSILNENNN